MLRNSITTKTNDFYPFISKKAFLEMSFNPTISDIPLNNFPRVYPLVYSEIAVRVETAMEIGNRFEPSSCTE